MTNRTASIAAKAPGRPFYAFYEERRAYPRVEMNLPVEIDSLTGGSVMADIHDISPDALQIRCDRLTAQRVLPKGWIARDEPEPVVEIRTNLKLTMGTLAFAARCRVIYVAVCPDGDIAFGFRFEHLDSKAAWTLERFVEESLTPTA